jgi:hypothetical protein
MNPLCRPDPRGHSGTGQLCRTHDVWSAPPGGIFDRFRRAISAEHPGHQFFVRFKRYIEIIHTGGGLLLTAVGILIFIGYLTVLNTWVIQLTPAWLWERLSSQNPAEAAQQLLLTTDHGASMG